MPEEKTFPASIPDLSDGFFCMTNSFYLQRMYSLPTWLKDLIEIGIMEATRRAKGGDGRAKELVKAAVAAGVEKLAH